LPVTATHPVRSRSSLGPVLTASILVLVMTGTPWRQCALAADGRDFSALYSVVPVAVSEDEVRFALSLQLSNHRGEAVSGVSIRVVACGPDRREVGLSAPTELPQQGSAPVSVEMVLTGSEYEVWQAGCEPTFEVSYTDTEGQERRTPIEAAQGPVPAGE